MSHLGNPIVGDPIYSSKHSKQTVPHLLLASKHLEFLHPITNQPMKYTIELPTRFTDFMASLENEK